MRQRSAGFIALGMSLISVAGAVATAILDEGGTTKYLGFATVVFVSVGAYVGSRVPQNAVGWLIGLFGLILGTYAFLETYGMAGLPNADWLLWFASMLWLPALIIMLVFVPLLFPDGRLLGPRWRWFAWSAVIGGLLVWLGNAFAEDLLHEYGFANPLQGDLPRLVQEIALLAGTLSVLLGIVAGVSAAVLRFRRSHGVVKQQMKWFAGSTLLLVPALLLQAWAYESGPRDLAPVFFLLGSLGIPLAIAVAILRYRLFEIDRIISRTASYAALVTVLGGLFAVGVVLVPNLVMSGEAPPWLVAATTLLVAALFNPLRKTIQTSVDRHFNRSRYDVERVAKEFAGSLRDETDTDVVVTGWLETVSATMSPSSLGVWIRD